MFFCCYCSGELKITVPKPKLKKIVFNNSIDNLYEGTTIRLEPVVYDEANLIRDEVSVLLSSSNPKVANIDGIGTLRAMFTLGSGGGASTISQQLAKQLFHGEGSRNIIERILQKAKEWIIAIRLERQYTKEEIIAQYFNIYDFGNNADGIRSASRIYFGKEPIDLNINESAILAGMLNNSSLYNPRRNPEGVTNRRNLVLKKMVRNEFISQVECDSLITTPLDINYNPESHREGIATYFRAYLDRFMKDWIKNNPKPDGSKYNLYNDGLKIYTTIDSRMQQYAEEAVQQHMPRLQAEFDHQNIPSRNPTAPFLELDKSEIDALLNRSMRQSERWRKMKYDLKLLNKTHKVTQLKSINWMTILS